MSLGPHAQPATHTTPLGLPGYTVGDLHDHERLSSLYDRFCEEVGAVDPGLWHEWEAYRSAPDAPRPPIALSSLLVAMAPHVSRFGTRLFRVQPSVDALTVATCEQDDLFQDQEMDRVDFVNLAARLRQNTVQEKLSNLWLDHLLNRRTVPHV